MTIRYYVSTEEASFFNNNRMGYANSIPIEGNYKVGDFIISSTQEDGIFGWVCTVAGNPGEWEVIGSGMNDGSGMYDKVVGYINAVSFSDTRSSVEIGIDEYEKGKDFLEVHYNGLLLAEGIHYNVSEDGKSIIAIDDVWNENADDTQQMIFRILKSEGVNVKELRNIVDINSACYEVEMGIDDYQEDKDIVEVHLNGVLLVQGLDYEIVEGKLSKLDRSEAWNPYNVEGQKMFVKVMRNNVVLVEPNDSSVTMEKLADDVKQAIEAAGNIDISGKQDVIDNNLATADKTIVGAINELFQNANNGKELIASAIGEPLDSNDTFSAMSNDINTMTINFRNALASKGVNAPTEKFEGLINKIEQIVQSNVLNNQIMIGGTYTVTTDTYNSFSASINPGFTPEYFILHIPSILTAETLEADDGSFVPNPQESAITKLTLTTTDSVYQSKRFNTNNGMSYNGTKYTLTYSSSKFNVAISNNTNNYSYIPSGTIIQWYAIGTEQLIHNGGARTITPTTSNITLNAGYYSGDITIKGDSDLKPENIVEGVEIFGVTGTMVKPPLEYPVLYPGTTAWFDTSSSYRTNNYRTSTWNYKITLGNVPKTGYYNITVSMQDNDDWSLKFRFLMNDIVVSNEYDTENISKPQTGYYCKFTQSFQLLLYKGATLYLQTYHWTTADTSTLTYTVSCNYTA